MSLQNAFENLAVESKQDAAILILAAIATAVADLDANTDNIETLIAAGNASLTNIDANTDGIEAILTNILAAVADLDANTDNIEALITAGNVLLGTIDTSSSTTATNTSAIAGAVKNEDAAAASGDAGIMALAVRNDADAVRTSADGDYTAISTDSAGRVKIVGTVTSTGGATEATQLNVLAAVDQLEGYLDGVETLIGTTNTNTGTTATNTTTLAGAVKIEDAAAVSGDAGIPALARRNDAAATTTSADGDYSHIATDAAGRVGIADLGGSITVDGTVAVSNQGLTDTQLRATPVPVTDAALATTNANQTNGTQKTQVVDGGGQVLDITATGAALVHVDRNAQVMDLGVWTPGTDDMLVVGGFISGTAVSGALALRAGSRGLLVEWVNAAGNSYGTSGLPVVVDNSKAEDAAHASGDRGAFMLGVRNDADAVRTSADGDYSPISTDSAGRVKVVGTITATGTALESTQLNVLAAVDQLEGYLDGVETLLSTTATWTHGQATVGVASAQLPSNANLRGITVKASSNNTVSIYVGNATGVTTATGFELAPGDSIDLSVDNTNDVWHISGTAAQSLSWAAN